MYVARLIVVLFLILAIVFTYSPLVQGEVGHAWEVARPGVLFVMDGLYAAIRDFVAGPDGLDGIEDDAPGVDFETVITMERGVLF